MKTKKLTLIMSIVLAVILLVTPLLTSCGSTATTTTNNSLMVPLKIGMMTPSTGPVPEKGIPGQHGIQDAMEYINNELGGAEGHPIQVDWQDSAYDMAKVGTIVQDLHE